MGHPLLDIHQWHPIVDELNGFGVTEGMRPKMKDGSIRATKLLLFRQEIESIADSPCKQGTACTPRLDSRKQVAFGIVLISMLSGDECNVRLDQYRYLIRNRNVVAENLCFLNVPTENPSSC